MGFNRLPVFTSYFLSHGFTALKKVVLPQQLVQGFYQMTHRPHISPPPLKRADFSLTCESKPKTHFLLLPAADKPDRTHDALQINLSPSERVLAPHHPSEQRWRDLQFARQVMRPAATLGAPFGWAGSPPDLCVFLHRLHFLHFHLSAVTDHRENAKMDGGFSKAIISDS